MRGQARGKGGGASAVGKPWCWTAVALGAVVAMACSGPGGGGRAEVQPTPADASAARALEQVAMALPQPVTAQGLELPPRVVLSELLADPLLRDEGVGDYVELASLATQSLRLADLALVMPSGKRLVLERPKLPWLRPGEVVVVRGAAPLAQDATWLIRAKGMRLPNSAGRVELWWRDRRVDVAQWQRRWPWPKARPGVALERVSPQVDGAAPQAWRRASGSVDGLERGSPGSVAWPCAAVAGSPLAQGCVEALRRGRGACRR